MSHELVRQIAIPVGALTLGSGLLTLRGEDGVERTVGKLAIYFGAQTGMNIYMKAVLSHAIVSADKTGMPAPFMVTAIQQVTAFVLFALFILLSRLTPHPYEPKVLKTQKEWLAVIIFSSSFVLNIALNNYSLSLIPISINLIIRSCLPLSTYAFQTSLGRYFGMKQAKEANILELLLMLAGVSCALLAVVAQNEHSKLHPESSPHLFLGVCVCLVSISSASINLALAGLLGSKLELNALDMTVYMAPPSFCFLIAPIFFMPHPINWVGWRHTSITDWKIFVTVVELSPSTIGLAVFSGAFALIYNALTYKIVQTLSATHTAMAGSFNNAATIVIALMSGMESLPPHPIHATVMVLAVMGNIGSFAGYNIVKASAREAEAKEQKLTVTELEQVEEELIEPKAREVERMFSFEVATEARPGDLKQGGASERGASERVDSSRSLGSSGSDPALAEQKPLISR